MRCVFQSTGQNFDIGGTRVQEDNTFIRKHIRQITGLPIEVKLDYASDDTEDTDYDEITNVSLGGLAFIASDRLDLSEHIKVRFPILNEDAELEGKVIWCEKTQRGYEIGLEFDDPEEVGRLKMVEQIYHIENYREKIKQHEGRELSSEQAAREWVSQYAGEFSALQ